jgi:hypothetical protein
MRKFLICGFGIAALTAAAFGQGFGDEHSTTTSQTTTTKTQSGDTTTTTTTTKTETNSGGFGFGLFGPPPGGSGGPSYESLGGSWQIGEQNGDKVCDLTLEKTKFISNYGARTGVGCPEGLFGVSSWMLAGDEIRLMSPGGSVLAKLHPAGRGRWNGSTTAGLAIFMTRQ